MITVISMILFFLITSLVLVNEWIKDSCKFWPEAATRSGILHLFGHENIDFLRERSGNF